MQKAEIASKEKSRASAVTLNVEIRRIKARLLEEVPKLQRLALKKVSLPLMTLASWENSMKKFNFCLTIIVEIENYLNCTMWMDTGMKWKSLLDYLS